MLRLDTGALPSTDCPLIEEVRSYCMPLMAPLYPYLSSSNSIISIMNLNMNLWSLPHLFFIDGIARLQMQGDSDSSSTSQQRVHDERNLVCALSNCRSKVDQIIFHLSSSKHVSQAHNRHADASVTFTSKIDVPYEAVDVKIIKKILWATTVDLILLNLRWTRLVKSHHLKFESTILNRGNKGFEGFYGHQWRDLLSRQWRSVSSSLVFDWSQRRTTTNGRSPLVDRTILDFIGVYRRRGIIDMRWLKRLLIYRWLVRIARNPWMLGNLYVFKKLEIGGSSIWISFCINCCHRVAMKITGSLRDSSLKKAFYFWGALFRHL